MPSQRDDRTNEEVLEKLEEIAQGFEEAEKALRTAAETAPQIETIAQAIATLEGIIGTLDAAIRGDGTPENLGILARLREIETNIAALRRAKDEQEARAREDERSNREAKNAMRIAVLSAIASAILTVIQMFGSK